MTHFEVRSILLVAEDDDDRSAFAEALRNDRFTVHCASSASQCIQVARTITPSLIVMERVLPDGDGLELVRILKSLSSTTDTPIIALSTDGSRRHIERALLVGCDAFLVTPCDSIVLISHVRRLLQSN